MSRIPCLTLLICAALSAQPSAPRPAFEVASIKPTPPGNGPGGGMLSRMMDMMQNSQPLGTIHRTGMRVSLRNQSLVNLIAAAYRVKTTQVSGPSWMPDQPFDVDATIPEGASPALANEMLQTLLEERFGLKLHRETREVSGYHLVVGKNGPKLTVSAPPPDQAAAPLSSDERAKVMADLQKSMQNMPRVAGTNRTSAKGVTSARLAEMVSRMAQAPVVDMTELQDKYDVTLETSADRPDEPGTTIFQAVEALGLKLVPRKLSVETVVVDSVAKTPTAN